MVKHESQYEGYETSAGGDVLTRNSHSSSHSMTHHHQIDSSSIVPPKCEDLQSTDQDSYNFIEDELNSNMRMISPSSSNELSMVMRQPNYENLSEDSRIHTEDAQAPIDMRSQQILDPKLQNLETSVMPIPKKRGRKKKGSEDISRMMVDGILKPILQKERKKHDRFNGMPEEEVSKRTLPDHLANNLDIIIIGINPGLFAAYKGHHYAGPGNHFWKCLYLSGLTHEQMTAEEDYKLLQFGIGFTNMVERATKGSADLTRKEIKEGSRILLEKLKLFRPKIAVFNGKLIFEVFSGKKDFNFGRQQECVEGTDTYMWVMPSSSARCAQLPRAADKVPFYTALKKFRDYLNGLIPHIDDIDCVFNDHKNKTCCKYEPQANPSPLSGPFLSPECQSNENQSLIYNNSNNGSPERGIITDISTNINNNNGINIMHKGSPMNSLLSSSDNPDGCGMVHAGINGPHRTNISKTIINMSCHLEQSCQPEKKKRGRPKKIKGVDGEEGPMPQKLRSNNLLNLTLTGESGETQKKKRGRPKKIKSEMSVSSNLASNVATNSNFNINNRIPTSNNMENGGAVIHNPSQNDVCLSRNSPNELRNHRIYNMNNSNQFDSLHMSQQQQSLQSQRLFHSPIHSPNTVSSYCPMTMNASTTPPTGNTNPNNFNLASSGVYHHQQHIVSHPMQVHQHNNTQQHVQHQYHTQPYMHSPNHTQSSKSSQYGSSQSDLSTEISAAIASDHLCESQPVSSPVINTVDYDRPNSIHNEDQSCHDFRFDSPKADSVDSQQGSVSAHPTQQYQNIYPNSSSNENYHSTNTNPNLGISPIDTSATNASDENINFILSNRSHATNSNASTPQPAQIQILDVTRKSLSGLESLVDQIPTMTEGENTSSLASAVGIKSDSNDGFQSPASAVGTSTPSGSGFVYIPTYANLNSSSSSSPTSAVPSHSSILSPHHYPDPVYSTANTYPSSANSNTNNNLSYNGLSSNFSVSSLTSNSYPANSYHSNLMAASAASSPHHIETSASGSSMFMDPHMPVAVSPLYHHPYAQHPGYGVYSQIPPPPPPTLHMPSPNYPYGYPNTSGFSSPQTHHPNHTAPSGYITNHSSMFDRLKPDIGYGGY